MTPQQQAAIDARDQKVLVAAAAGSGKTAVLVKRIISMLNATEGGCDVDHLLVLTFTKAAAAEMRQRIEAALQETLEQAKEPKQIRHMERQLALLSGAAIATFDSFCQRVLRMHVAELDVDPQFRVMDKQEGQLLAQEVVEQLAEALYDEGNEKFLHFADAYGNNKGDKNVWDMVAKVWGMARSMPFPEEWLQQQPEQYQVPESDIWSCEWLSTHREEYQEKIRRMLAGVEVFVQDTTAVGCQGYIFAAQDMATGAQACKKALANGGAWDELYEAVQGIPLPAMNRKPYTTGSRSLAPEEKAPLKAQLDVLKEQVQELQQEIFVQDEAAVRQDLQSTQEFVTELCRLTLRYGQALQAAKREKRLIDFADMEHFALNLLCDTAVHQATGQLVPSPVALALQEKYQAIMVDEYQDTNQVQEDIVSLITRQDHPDVFMVGDVKQSIYRFRQADPEIFQKKQGTYSKAPEALERLIPLSKNFRSRASVLDSINVLFTQLMQPETMEIAYDADAALYPGLPYPALPEGTEGLDGPLELVTILEDGATQTSKQSADHSAEVENGDVEEEADIPAMPEPPRGLQAEGYYIARRIMDYVAAKTQVYDKHTGGYREMTYRDIVILMRSTKGEGAAPKGQQILECLRAYGIPAYAELDAGYFEAQEVRVMLAFLTCLDNVRQEIPLAAVLASPIGGFTMADLAQLRLVIPKGGDLYDALLTAYQQNTQLKPHLADKAAAFCDQLSVWRRMARDMRVPELIDCLYQQTGYYNYVGGLPGGQLRQANLRLLIDRASAYEQTSYHGLYRFLRYIDRLRRQETDLAAARTLGAGENVVRIMTIHKSKGLEFPLVFLADCGKGFNKQDLSSRLLLHKHLGIALQIADRETGQVYKTLPWRMVQQAVQNNLLAEEMRILYVALTRAREKLILTHALSAKSWENKLKKCCAFCDVEGEVLPAEKVQACDNYLDWCLMALARVPGGAALREQAGVAAAATLSLPKFAHAAFALPVVSAVDYVPQETGDSAQSGDILTTVHQGELLPATREADEVAAILGWHYPQPELAKVTAKLSVSEIKRRFREADEQPQAVTASLLPDSTGGSTQPWQRPAFLQARSRTGAEYGTLLHTVMQHLDFTGDTSYHGLQAQLQSMVTREIIRAEDVPSIYIKSLQAFCDSPLGQELRTASHVWRELPFCRLLPATDFYQELPTDSQAECFVQGIIDLLYEDAAGELVLVDYKTDRDTDAQRAHDRHHEQIALYRAAVEAITGRTVNAAWLFMLKDGTMVAM